MTTKDIILRAEQYANKENADFYSYAEKVAMLNESWNTLYQYLCNTGDKYWVKRVSFTGKEIALPKDCYQISAVYKKVGNNEVQIYKYSLINNTIKLDKFYNLGSDSFILEYYPRPTTFTFRDAIRKCPFQLEGMLDIQNGRVLGYANDNYYLYDTATKQTKNFQFSSTRWLLAHIYKDSAIVGVNSNGRYDISYDGTLIASELDTIVIYNNCVHFIRSGNLVDVMGNVIRQWEITEPGWYTTEDFNTFTKQEGVLAVNNSVSIIKDTYTGIVDGTKSYTTYKIIGYFDTNSFLTRDALTSTYYIESECNDVNVDYPNNVFFTYLAIDVALKMRSKQGIDNAQLDSQWAIAKNALFNSIEKNKGNHVTIKDVYTDDECCGIYY